MKVIELFYEKLKEFDGELSQEAFKKLVKEVGKELKAKGKNLFMPIRIALTGKMSGVELPILVELLGKKRTLKRIENTLEQLNGIS